jgi:hypothetical protein
VVLTTKCSPPNNVAKEGASVVVTECSHTQLGLTALEAVKSSEETHWMAASATTTEDEWENVWLARLG